MAGRQRRQVPQARALRSAPVVIGTGNDAADRVLASLAQGIQEQQLSPAAALKVIENVELADTLNVYVAHGLGRRPRFVGVSAVRGATGNGIVRDVTDGAVPGVFNTPVDRNRYVVLRADGHVTTIHVDILVL